METAARGNAAEAAILCALVVRGYQVSVPFGGGHPYDLVIHLGGHAFVRVQCKAAREHNGRLLFNGRTTDHGRGRLPYDGLADVFGVHCARTGRVFIVPVREAGVYVVTLRVVPTANNQRRGVRFADDYSIETWTAGRFRAVIEHEDSRPRLRSAA